MPLPCGRRSAAAPDQSRQRRPALLLAPVGRGRRLASATPAARTALDCSIASTPYVTTIGNPNGTATLVEFFDYNCHFCKGALPDVTKLMKDDPNLKLVLKDYPVLGPGSVEAAKVASAVRNQLPGDKFWVFHTKLLATHGPGGKTEALAVARDLGLDMDKLAKDMQSPDVKTGLDEVMQLADALQINGTPTFVVGQDVVVGAVGYDQLKDKVDSVHKCGHATC